MKYSLAAAGLFALILPLSASAQAAISHSNASPQGGIGIFAGGEGDAQTDPYLTALTNDINAHYNYFTSSKGNAPLSTSQVNSAGIWAGSASNSDSYGFVTGAGTTLNRVCDDIDSTLGAGHNGKMVSYVGDDYASEGNNSIILFNGSQWRWQSAKGSSNHHLRNLVCNSYALPQNKLSASDYNVTPGQNVTLTWNDTAARDQMTTADGSASDISNPVPTTSCTATGFTLPTTPVQVCTSSELEPTGGGCQLLFNSTPSPLVSNLAAAQIGGDGELAAISGGCTYRRVCLLHKTVNVAAPSGSVTVKPTTTTTYKYTCTNANGTTLASAKVTVASSCVSTYGNSCSSAANACGQTNTGTVACDGSCTASAPANPSYYGKSCTSPANSCGMTNTGTLNCSNQCTATTPSNSTCPKTGPDLTADAITPTTAAAGISVSLKSVISNIGDASTMSGSGGSSGGTCTGACQAAAELALSGGGFTNLFQKATSANGAGATDIGTSNRGFSLAAGGSFNASLSYTFPSTGTYYVRACADKASASDTGSITESNENNNCGAWTAIVVGSPDLTAGNISPTTAQTNKAVNLTALITNQGDADTGAALSTFSDLFEINPNAIPATFGDITTLRAATMSEVDAGLSKTANLSYTFSSPGTYYVRACADMDTNGNGAVTESSESNNCGSWVAVTVTTPTLTCDVSDTTIDQQTGSQTVTYTASPTTATPYAWTASDGATGFGTAYSTTRDFSSVTPGTYGMTVSGTGYASVSCPQVTVSNACTAAPVTLNATPNRVNKGDATTLSWVIPSVAQGVASCILNGSDGSTYQIPVSSCAVAGGGGSKDTAAIQSQTTYTLTCGSQTATAIVDVTPNFNEF